MPARTARYFKKLKNPPFNRRMAVSNHAVATAAESRSGDVRRLQTSLSFARKGVIVTSTETILYLKKCRPRRRTTREKIRAGRGRPAFQRLLHAIADFAVLHAIGEVNDQPNDKPNNQTHPGDSVQRSEERRV